MTENIIKIADRLGCGITSDPCDAGAGAPTFCARHDSLIFRNGKRQFSSAILSLTHKIIYSGVVLNSDGVILGLAVPVDNDAVDSAAQHVFYLACHDRGVPGV